MKVTLEFNDKIAEKYSEHDLKMYCAVGLYRERVLSTGKLAEILGMERLDFIDEMGKYGCGILDMTEEELKMELENADRYLPV